MLRDIRCVMSLCVVVSDTSTKHSGKNGVQLMQLPRSLPRLQSPPFPPYTPSRITAGSDPILQ